MADACSVYIYYRVAAAQQAAARERVTQLFAQLAAQSGIHGRLLCRRDDDTTWMEVYAAVSAPEAFLAQLKAAETTLALASLIEGGQRHVEVFQPR
ncbi:DUF4936 family protein [Uliginosibacterium sediminicola]|uniref:DUF4936 family protein n=1 Tax=Uliginosibacterium sediminicola TaxID=2024550 RepID=A0ABU9YVI3_9RHOO